MAGGVKPLDAVLYRWGNAKAITYILGGMDIMLSHDIALILRLMIRTGLSFGEIQRKLREIDKKLLQEQGIPT